MAEYIEREDLIRRLELSIKSWSRDCNSNAPVMVRTYEDVLHKVKNLPSADVVKVVRCWKCRHCDPVNKHCDHYTGTGLPFPRKENDFCSYGELKESEG